MALIILGLIVVLGGCLLIYYQLGPKVTMRLKGGFGNIFGGPAADGEIVDVDPVTTYRDEPVSDGKVIYVFGDGAREERPLREDDGQGDEE
ncbi:MAG: hypothetical protein FWH32_04475 [Clostridiales bacterium]|nr:hypothetical protein [Clostridiales bacterium]